MKINGKTIDSLRTVSVYLPVANNDAVEFKFRPLRSDESFEKISPMPQPAKQVRPGGATTYDTMSSRYQATLEEWNKRRLDWEFLRSASATPGLEWESVDMDDPKTWGNWRADLGKLFPDTHIAVIFRGFVDAQYITEETMEKARQLFLLRTLDQFVESPASDPSPKEEKTSTESGAPVNG
jgi:hypothetical protein